jgi:Flp pilus assembly protein TadG
MKVTQTVRRWRQGKRAQATLELALVLPFFLMILFSLFEFGRALVEYTSVSNSAREGARVGIVPSKTVTEITTAARNATVTVGTLPAVTVTAFRGGTQLADPATRTSGDTVQVQVSHTFVPIFWVAQGYIPDVIGGLGVSIPMSSTAKMRVE